MLHPVAQKAYLGAQVMIRHHGYRSLLPPPSTGIRKGDCSRHTIPNSHLRINTSQVSNRMLPLCPLHLRFNIRDLMYNSNILLNKRLFRIIKIRSTRRNTLQRSRVISRRNLVNNSLRCNINSHNPPNNIMLLISQPQLSSMTRRRKLNRLRDLLSVLLLFHT